jgi:hypothetical protein
VSAAGLASHYQNFSEAARGRSPLYVDIAAGVARDPQILSLLASLPAEKQQPNLLLAAVKYLFGAARDYAHFRSLVLTQWDAISALMRVRRTQTNEPARCATLLPVLAQLTQPLALLEVGASAGLCLYPDRYGYDYGTQRIAPPTPQAPLFRCAANAATPLPTCNVEVVWRAGLDLNPLDCRDESDVNWLKALVWPGEGEREKQLEQALAIVRADPPHIVKGDLRQGLGDLAAQAPFGATLVIFHSAVLNYVGDPSERSEFAAAVVATGAEWLAQEDPDIFATHNQRSWPAGSFFLLTHNGRLLARAESHGAQLEWLA